jgi:hypothetical protein
VTEPASLDPADFPCTVRTLPDELLVEAAKIAVEINPQNAPAVPAFALAAAVTPEHLAVYTQKRWGPKVDLSVRFLDTTNAALKAKILEHFNAWNRFGDIRFRESGSLSADIRVTLNGGGYWSYLGTDCRSIPAGQPTMSLHGFALSTPESEYKRVVRHEVGHAIGCPHEHARPEVIERLDRAKVVAEFKRTQGWSEREIVQQIFTPPPPGSIMATALAEETSIMCYSFPARLTKNGVAIPGGADITPLDGKFIGSVYPKADAPPPPPPVDPPPANTFEAAVIATIRAQGYKVEKPDGPPPKSFVADFVEFLKARGF